MITVGFTNSSDVVDSNSNQGSCVDLFAPGADIVSAWDTGDNATHTLSGSSQAAPLVAGAAALYLQDHLSATPSEVKNDLVGTATSGRLSGITLPGTPNLLLYALRPSPLSVSVTGPTYISAKGTYTFTVSYSGYVSPTIDWTEKPCYAAGDGFCTWHDLGGGTTQCQGRLRS